MKKIVLTSIVLSVIVLFSACVEDISPEATWTLVSLDDGKTDFEKEDGTLKGTVTLSIIKQSEKEYGISGFSGVNHFNGVATIDGRSITVSPLAVTMMIGSPETQMVEDSFLKILQDGGKLSVEKDDGEIYLSIKQKKNDTELEFVQTLLENTSWNLAMYNVGTAVTNVPAALEGVMLAFSADGKVYGSTGVNNIMGSYVFTDDGSLTFSSMGTTRMAAPNQEVRDFELRLLELFEKVQTFEISGQNLTLRNKEGESLLVYSR